MTHKKRRIDDRGTFNMKLHPIIYILLTLIISSGVTSAGESDRLSGIEGEYRGTVKRTEMTLWAAPVTGPGAGKALALMFFPTAQRQTQADRLMHLTDALLASRQNICDIEKVFEQVYRPGFGTHAGLVLVHGDWYQKLLLKINRFPGSYWMVNDEYIFLREREYMVKEFRRDPETGELIDLRLTRTGFIQNFFDNPRLRLAKIETASAELELLTDYVNAKFAAHNALNAALEGVPQESVTPCP